MKTIILTQKIAKQFLADEDSVGLSEFTSIEDAAAQTLAKHKRTLGLSGLTSLSDAAAESLAKHEGYLWLDGEAEEALTAAKVRLGIESDEDVGSEDGSEEEESDQSEAGEEDEPLKLTVPHHNAINLLVRKTAALLVARDGQVTAGEQDWLEAHWGVGAHAQVIHLARTVAEDSLRGEMQSLLEDQTELASALKGELEELIPLVSLDEDGDAVKLHSLIELVASFTRTIVWEGDFLKSAKERFEKKLLLNQEYSSVEILLNSAVSYGTSEADIIKWLEENDICNGGDAACQKAVELAWLVGAWAVSYETLTEAMEDMSAGKMTHCAAEAIAEAVVPG